jgi:hypothetical protein
LQLYEFPASLKTRWFSPENPKGLPGKGGLLNKGAKGRPSVFIKPKARLELLKADGPGLLRRIWLTCSGHNDPLVLSGMRLRMYWEGSRRPAVDCALGDFFGVALGRKAAFESAFFSDPEGRSFNCFIPMPFRKKALVELVNGTAGTVQVFYELNATLGDALGPDSLSFHALSRSESPNRLGRDYTVLPALKGRGRYLGAHFGLVEDKRYAGGWFGEGELKLYLDGDGAQPTLCGTGTEDMIGSAWGQGRFSQRLSGCTVKDTARGEWCFYRYHADDPVVFHRAFKAGLQVMGGAFFSRIEAMRRAGAKLKIVSVMRPGRQHQVMERGLPKKILPGQWCNFWRQDAVCSTAYFYLDRPSLGSA